jgi:hypothetical protein
VFSLRYGLSHYTAIISLISVNQLIFVMVKCGVLFEVRTESLHSIISLISVNQLIFVMVKCGVLFEVRTDFVLYRRASALKG